MIKLLHIADIHLGMENYGKIDKKTGLHSRLSDFLNCFDYAIDFALKNKIDFFLFAGDAFKTRDPSPTYQREFAKRIKRIASANIPVILVIGNHDLPNISGKADTLEIYKTLEVENVYVSRKPEILNFTKLERGGWQLVESSKLKAQSSIRQLADKTQNLNQTTKQTIVSDNNEKPSLQIATLPWVSKSEFLTGKEFQGKTISEAYNLMSKKLIDKVKNLENNINPEVPAVLVSHTTVAGATFGSEQKAYVGNDILLPLNVIAKRPWDYVGLGHLHKYQILSKNPPVIYSGSIDRIDFGEEKEDKGFVVFDIDDQNQTQFKFIKTPARKFKTIKIKINKNDLDPTKIALDEIKKNNLKETVARVLIEIPENLAENLDSARIRETLASAYFVAAINYKIVKSAREKNLENIEEMSVLEALEKYLQVKKTTSGRIEILKKYAGKIIEQ
jgi:exonuclease SbcD